MKMIRKITVCLLAAATVWLCGCTGLVEQLIPEDTAVTTQAPFVPVDVEEGTVYFRDFDGNVITLKEAPQSVASLSPVSTEILCGIGAGRYITIMNESSSNVEGAPISAVKVPDFYSDTEKLSEMKPDIVFYSTDVISSASLMVLKNTGLTLIRIPEKGTIATAEANIRFISSIMFKDQAGEKLIGTMRFEFEKMRVAAEIVGVRKKVYIEGLVFSSYGGDSIVSELCEYAGADNVFKDKKTPYLTNAAEVTDKDPEVIIVLTNDTENFKADGVRKRNGLENVTAVRRKMIYPINITAATRPTQNITKALRSIGEALKVTK